MFKWSKKSTARKKENEPVNANEFLKVDLTDDNQELETELSIPDEWDTSTEDRYVFAFHNNESPKLKVNQISIYGMELSKTEQNDFKVTGLIRNTVQQTIQFQPTVIMLLGDDGQVIAKKEFDLSELGPIPKNGARPWTFNFPAEAIITDVELPIDVWSLAFQLETKHQLDLDKSWEESIAEDTKASLEKIVEDAEPLKAGEVNFLGLSAKFNDNEDLAVTLLIRNGSEKHVTLEQIPLGVKDATDEEIAKGGFKLTDFTVKANTSKPWTFIFPKSMILKDEIDLSRWTVYPIQ